MNYTYYIGSPLISGTKYGRKGFVSPMKEQNEQTVLVEKILVSEPVEVDGQKIQRLTIHYKFIGALETLE